jgi:deoxyuridine 5'-triphosphate nucleotidohydrolase
MSGQKKLVIEFAMAPGCEDLVPTQANPDDTGWDVKLSMDWLVRANVPTVMPTGVVAHPPAGYGFTLRPRSGHTSRGQLVQLGTIDHGYVGEIGVIMFSNRHIQFHRGDSVAQLVLEKVHAATAVVVPWDTKRETARGAKGFGSSDAP